MTTTSTEVKDEIWSDNIIIPIPEMLEMNVPTEQLADIFYLGYPIGLHSNNWLHAFTRRCTIALPSTDGIPVKEVNPNEFLVDSSPFEGDSGSPVFIRTIHLDEVPPQIRVRLIGVMLGYLSWDQISKTESKTRDVELSIELKRKNNLGLGRIAPARYIVSAIEDLLIRISESSTIPDK